MTLTRFAKRTAIAAAALAATACTTVGPDYKVPANAVVKRAAASKPFLGSKEAPFKSEPLPADWWRLYHDSTLDKLVEKAFAANADLRVAAANLRRSHAVLEEVEEKKRPEVEMEAAPAYGRIAGASLAMPETLPNMGLYSASVKVSYQLDLFGKIKRAIEAAEADHEAAQAASDIAHVTVAAEVAQAYAAACSAGYQFKVAQHSLDLQGQFVKLTENRVKLGRGIALDNSRARAQYEQLRAALPPSNFPAEVAKCDVPPRVQSTIPVGDGAALLRRRPDIRQAERTLAGYTARIGVATAELYPSIDLGLGFGSIGMIPGVGDSNTWHFNVGPLIRWNLPALSSARVHIAQAEAGTEGALARFDSVVLNALRETETALTVYARELDRNAALKASRDQQALASHQADKLYDFGRADFLTKLDADRALATAENAVAASDTQLAADQVTLFLALGGGWESSHAKQEHGEHHGEKQGEKHDKQEKHAKE
jgi:outer membrane protein TolC